MGTPFLLDTDVLIAKIEGRYQRRYAKSHGMGLADAIIAASAITEEATLKTLNVKHYPMFKELMPAYKK
jgi:predicted nucleic acid-binding protein